MKFKTSLSGFDKKVLEQPFIISYTPSSKADDRLYFKRRNILRTWKFKRFNAQDRRKILDTSTRWNINLHKR